MNSDRNTQHPVKPAWQNGQFLIQAIVGVVATIAIWIFSLNYIAYSNPDRSIALFIMQALFCAVLPLLGLLFVARLLHWRGFTFAVLILLPGLAIVYLFLSLAW